MGSSTTPGGVQLAGNFIDDRCSCLGKPDFGSVAGNWIRWSVRQPANWPVERQFARMQNGS